MLNLSLAALRFRSEERIKYEVRVSHWQSHAHVTDRNQQVTPASRFPDDRY